MLPFLAPGSTVFALIRTTPAPGPMFGKGSPEIKKSKDSPVVLRAGVTCFGGWAAGRARRKPVAVASGDPLNKIDFFTNPDTAPFPERTSPAPLKSISTAVIRMR